MHPILAKALGLSALLAAAWVPQALGQPNPPLGHWVTGNGNLEVEIAPCGDALCGTVTRVLANRSMVDPTREAEVPPAEIGLRLLSDLRPSGERYEGKIFNRENGKTYDCLVMPAQAGTLDVRPYVFISLFGKTQTWQRAQGGYGAMQKGAAQ